MNDRDLLNRSKSNPTELDGFVYFREHIGRTIDGIEDGGERKQTWLRDNGYQSQHNPRFQDVDSWHGFFFVIENPADGIASFIHQKTSQMNLSFTPEQPIPLICPLNVMNEVANAATMECKVRIHHYKIIVVQDIINDDVSRSENQKQKYHADLGTVAEDEGNSSTFYFMELASNGITILHKCESTQQQINNTSNSIKLSSIGHELSLGEFQKLEDSERDVIRYNKNHEYSFFLKKPSLSQRKFSIWAVVDAVSPIISLKKGESFAIIELYQENYCRKCHGGSEDNPSNNIPHFLGWKNEEITSIAVLKGKALLRHQSLEPGQKIIMHDVHRQKWHVPQSFQKKNFANLHGRAPTHVFVISDPVQLTIVQCSLLPFVRHVSKKNVKLEGTITEVVLHSDMCDTANARGSIVYYIIEWCNNEIGKVSSPLYVHHCPIPHSLAYGLRVGAVIRASNIHYVTLWSKNEGYAACIRSTITILECASTTSDNNNDTIIFEKSRPFMSSGFCLPYEIVWRKKVMEYLGSDIIIAAKTLNESAEKKKYFPETLLGLIIECAGPKKQSGCEQSHSLRQRIFDPYADFFCHTYDQNAGSSRSRYSCVADQSKHELPVFVSLRDLKNICSSHMAQKIVRNSNYWVERKTSVRLEAGLIYTDHLSANWLIRQLLPKRQLDNKCDLICMGFAEVLDSELAIKDEKNRIPLVGSDSCVLQINGAEKTLHDISNDDWISVNINQVIASVMCLGRLFSSNNGAVEIFDLPSAATKDPLKMEKINGACSMFHTGGFAFLVAIHIRLLRGVAISSHPSQKVEKMRLEAIEVNQAVSLLEVLNNKIPYLSPSFQSIFTCTTPIFQAVLVRQRFRLKKIENKLYSGFTITLGPLPEAPIMFESRCRSTAYIPIQSIDVKVEINLSNHCLDMMRSLILSSFHSEMQKSAYLDKGKIAVATAWWTFADNSKFCSFLAGGWDEKDYFLSTNDFEDTFQHQAVVVSLSASYSSDDVWKTKLQDIRCYFVNNNLCHEESVLGDRFHAVAGRKFFPGNLTRCSARLARSTPYMPCELAASPSKWCGVFDTTIAQLYHLTCQDLNDRCCMRMALSKVWNISRARLISLNYCRARAQCTQCYEFLVPKNLHSDTYTTIEKGMSGDLSPDLSANAWHENYWNRHKTVAQNFNTSSDDKVSSSAESNLEHSEALAYTNAFLCNAMRCPSGCSISHSSIYWECSGSIDDGSGQAKLYAERDAAKLLLGNSFSMQKVEEGAWHSKEGIWFSRTVPFLPKIAYEVSRAKVIHRGKKGAHRCESACESEVLNLMAPTARAQYILYKHCRDSEDHLRRMKLAVRCKPMKHGSIRKVQLETMSRGCHGFNGHPSVAEIATFSLPILKLQLVDSSSASCEDEVGWDLLNTLNSLQP